MSNSLRPHGLKHARHARPLLSPGGCSNSYVHWVDDAILFAPFSSCPQSFPASGSLPVSRFFTSGLPLHHQGSPDICHFWSNLSLTILFPQSPLPSPAERERERHQQFPCRPGFPFLRIPHKEKSESEVTQSCLTLCNPMDCSPPRFSIHGIFQARVLDWVAISFSRGSSWPRDRTWVSCVVSRCFTVWATREVEEAIN